VGGGLGSKRGVMGGNKGKDWEGGKEI
jgi:hypothetical protein